MYKAYFKYRVNRKPISSINNLFTKKLYDNVFSKLDVIKDSDIQLYRKKLASSNKLIEVNDLGAGSKTTSQNVRSVRSIFKSASVSPKFGKLLNQLIKAYNCQNILELGTSLGVGTYYLALNNFQSQIVSIEGCSAISQYAQTNLKVHKNIEFKIGEFSTVLKELEQNSFEFIYIDGNHTYEATMDYYYWCLKYANANAILVFDDIYWSKGMQKAWQTIIKDSHSRVTLDLFRMGIVFLKPELKKTNYTIKF